ncbi:subunit length determinant protein [Thiogranum longum]|uniref:Subunit length determinant protein n=1 Tax=Thiogranum longum TaxID=1537524 RepID=A0A4R1HCW4_9GAMM|nr:Wzz/FepE/Etk N-terminal domain-containing protein [Thiogranum longum]TCK18115.1 subunit length determinant protein [Thiogranum longum]
MYARDKLLRDKRKGAGHQLPGIARVPVSGDRAETYADEGEISLYDLWQVVSKYRMLVLGIAMSAIVLAMLASWLKTPLYRAEVLLAPVTEQDGGSRYLQPFKEFGGIAALAGVNLNRGDKKSESIATLKSRKFNEQFIQDNKLDRILFSDRWDEKSERWDVSDKKDEPTLWDSYEKFNKQVRTVREDRNTGLVTLSIEWNDPEIAAQWANALVSSINQTLRQQTVETSRQAIAYLQEQLGKTSVVELQQVLHQLIESEMKKIIFANINEAYAFKVIDPATAPEEPFNVRLVMTLVLSAIFGLIFGIVVALVVNAIRGERNAAGASAD